MNLGYVLKFFPRLSETFIVTELASLEALGATVHVFSRYHPDEAVPHSALGSLRAEVRHLAPLLQERLWEALEVHCRLARRFGRDHDGAMRLALAQRCRQEARYWLQSGAVAEQAVGLGLDCLHGHFATGSASVVRYASRITGIPYSFTAHAKDIYARDVNPERLRDLLEDAAFVVTVSDANLEYLRALAPRANVVRLYNGLDLGRFPCLPEPPTHETPLVLSVARLVEKKGLGDLVDALALLRGAGRALRCRLVGTGPLEPELRARVHRSGLDDVVEFVGAASQEEITNLHLPEASVFALPCIVAADGDRDGLPTTLLEAMARGVPVVSTRLPGIPEAVPELEAGLLADPGDAAGLARALSTTLDDREGTIRRARVARRRVETLFDSRANTRRLLDLFESAARAHVRRGGTGL